MGKRSCPGVCRTGAAPEWHPSSCGQGIGSASIRADPGSDQASGHLVIRVSCPITGEETRLATDGDIALAEGVERQFRALVLENLVDVVYQRQRRGFPGRVPGQDSVYTAELEADESLFVAGLRLGEACGIDSGAPVQLKSEAELIVSG